MNEDLVIALRRCYPKGTRVVLDEMADSQAPTIGTQGTVQFVDDIGTIHVAWDNGSGLGVCYGEDRCHTVSTEEELKTTLAWYGRYQPKENAICPRCGELMPGKTSTHALSRWADVMVCDFCGGMEAMEAACLVPKKLLADWFITQNFLKGETL